MLSVDDVQNRPSLIQSPKQFSISSVRQGRFSDGELTQAVMKGCMGGIWETQAHGAVHSSLFRDLLEVLV